MQKPLAVLIVTLVAALGLFYLYQNDWSFIPKDPNADNPVIRIGNVPIRVEIADTPTLRSRGLSGRQSLAPTAGMLFIFDKADYHSIWMKDMLLVIDVIWIGENLRVVDITRELRPETYPRTFEPATPARFAIETNANYAESFGIRVGDTVELPAGLIPEDLRP